MLRTPVILGISMAARKNRRLLVAATYAPLLAFTVTFALIAPGGKHLGAIWVGAGNACLLVSWGVFRSLVKQLGPLDLRGGEMTSLGLAPRRRRAEDEPDEREVGVRNAAYFAAYRVLAWYSIIMWMAVLFTLDLAASARVKLLMLSFMPLLAMASTLPQALVLWTEPDVPEEARV